MTSHCVYSFMRPVSELDCLIRKGTRFLSPVSLICIKQGIAVSLLYAPRFQVKINFRRKVLKIRETNYIKILNNQTFYYTKFINKNSCILIDEKYECLQELLERRMLKKVTFVVCFIIINERI